MPVDREMVTLTAADGAVHDALLHIDGRALRARERRTGRRTAVMHVHGVMGNFLVGTLRFVPPPLARAGYPVLVVETRMGNVGQLFGQAIFDEATLDMDAAVRWLRSQGFTHVVACGYSSGASLATRWAATRHLPELRGLISLAGPWGLPQSLAARSQRNGAQPSYDEIVMTLRRAIGGDTAEPDDDRIFVIERSRGPTRAPRDSEVYTYRTWWHSRGPNATPAMAFRQIGQVWAPVLLVQGDADEHVALGEAHDLAAAARRAGNPDVDVAPIAGADHSFTDRELVTGRAVIGWLSRRA